MGSHVEVSHDYSVFTATTHQPGHEMERDACTQTKFASGSFCSLNRSSHFSGSRLYIIRVLKL